MAWLRKGGFGGVAVWSLDSDDYQGICGGDHFPLLRTIKQGLAGYRVRLQYHGPYESNYYMNKNREAADMASILASIASRDDKITEICSSEEFRCNNGQCIDHMSRCDGKPQCIDGSDETYTLCKTFQCPLKSYRCRYGGCIESFKKCNGIQNCIDGSDETSSLCFNYSSPEGCVAPPSFPGTKYVSSLCEDSDTSPICIAKSGTIMAFGSMLTVRCSEGYQLIPGASNLMTCTANEEYTPFPPTTCKRTCPPLVIYPNVQTECKLTDYEKDGHSYHRILPCDLPMAEGTKVTFSCPLHFKRQTKIITCMENGGWDSEPTMECEPLCGIKRETLVNRIDGGSVANQTEYPWHAGIYHYDTIDGHVGYKYVCGGSLISQSAVLTAAHCGVFEGRPYPTDQMFVALGKQKVQWDSEEGNTQRFSVKEFVVLQEYSGQDGSYSFDIAVIILAEPVMFNDHVRPVCVNNLPSRFRDDKAVGQLPGWGITAGDTRSKDLSAAKIPYVNRKKCLDMLKIDLNQRILTHDKFCGGFLGKQGAKAEQGDSGGGLVYHDSGLYYVVGVVSTTILRENFRIGAYTNVSTHYDWIRKKMKQ